ncbi:MAG: hypothetical protein M0Q53_15315 [Prolixibacteraceae bacterium]|jgi:hypothetical protein|nr:hypothetical protein [Prolixibacteraceae bacterium]
MTKIFVDRISNDLKESQINWKVAFLLIPIAFFTYFFHEFGHWVFGEISGNDMTISLNNSAPKSGYFINNSSALWSAIGGPAFTILQSFIFLLVVQRTQSKYAYSVLFFGVFSRFFSIFFGGFSLQDEARISSMLGVNAYLTAVIVLLILLLILLRSNLVMKLDLKAVGYFTTICTLANLLVIGVNHLMK